MFNIKKCKCVLVDTCQIKDIWEKQVKKSEKKVKKNIAQGHQSWGAGGGGAIPNAFKITEKRFLQTTVKGEQKRWLFGGPTAMFY